MEPDWVIVGLLVAAPLAVLATIEAATRWGARREEAIARRSKSGARGPKGLGRVD